MTKTATLSSDIVFKKGQAMPAVVPHAEAQAPAAAKPAASNYYKALTVKLDRERYEALKTLGLKRDKKSQEILVLALDRYLLEERPGA